MEEKKHLPAVTSALDLLAVEMANLTLQGKNISQMERETGWSRKQIRKLMKRTAFEAYMKEVDGHARAVAKTYIRNSIRGMAPKIVAALEQLIEKGNAKGVELALRTIGAMEQPDESRDKGSAPIQVFMPGAVQKDEFVVESEVRENENE